jgi:hypothetical protein
MSPWRTSMSASVFGAMTSVHENTIYTDVSCSDHMEIGYEKLRLGKGHLKLFKHNHKLQVV